MKNEFIDGIRLGVEKGKQDALLEFQKENPLKDLPNNETLYKIFKLLFKCIETDSNVKSAYHNPYSRYAEYITLHWND